MKNARFHVYVNGGYVKLTLRPGQSLQWAKSEWNGEGSSWQWDKWENDNGVVINTYASGGRDCDGIHREGGARHCAIDKLKGEADYEDSSILKPEWINGAAEVYDQYAELANY